MPQTIPENASYKIATCTSWENEVIFNFSFNHNDQKDAEKLLLELSDRYINILKSVQNTILNHDVTIQYRRL